MGVALEYDAFRKPLRGDDSSAVDAGQVVLSFLVSFTQSFFLIHNEQFKGVGIE